MINDTFRLFISPNSIQKNALCYCDGMGFEAIPSFYINRKSFNNYLIMHTIYGELWCFQYGKKYVITPGESILIDLHNPHIYHFAQGTPTKIAWTHINGEPASKLIENINKIHPLPIKKNIPEIYDKLLNLFEISNHPNRDIFEQSQISYSLLLEFLKEEWKEHSHYSENEKQKEFKMKMWHYISHNLYRDITLDELADFASLSKYHFIRTFHNAFGIPPIQFIIEEKIRQAKYQLTNTTDSVACISDSLGFSTPSYFSKVFKNIEGISPLQYRKQM